MRLHYNSCRPTVLCRVFVGDSTEEILAADAEYSDHPLCENIADNRGRGEIIYANFAYSFHSVLLVAPANYYYEPRLSLNSCGLARRDYVRDIRTSFK